MLAELVVYWSTIVTQRGAYKSNTMTDWLQTMHEWRQQECANLDSTFLNTSNIFIDQNSKLCSLKQDLVAPTALNIRKQSS